MNPSPKLTDQEECNIATAFGSSSQDECIETNTKIIMTHVLKRCNETKYISHQSICAFTLAETVALNTYSVELK